MNKKLIGIIGGAVALIAIIVACIFIFAGGKDEYRSIKVFEIDGTCKVERGGDTLDAFKNMALSSGDVLTVGDGSFTRLKLDDDKYVYLEAGTKISLTATGTSKDSKTTVFIERGSMLTEVKKKLSATSSYDIVTPNTTMSIRGTKTLTEVIEDVVTGHVQTSNAVLEGQVKIKAVKVKADGTVVSVERDLGAGEGNAFKSSKEELVSQEEMQAIAETGASVSGIKVEIVSEEEAGVVFDVATFDATFLESVKSILIADAEAAAGEGLSDEELDAINTQIEEAIKSLDVISEESQKTIDEAAEMVNPPTPEPTLEPVSEPTPEPVPGPVSDLPSVTDDNDQDEGTTVINGDTNLIDIGEDAGNDAGIGDENDDADDEAGTSNENDDADDEAGTGDEEVNVDDGADSNDEGDDAGDDAGEDVETGDEGEETNDENNVKEDSDDVTDNEAEDNKEESDGDQSVDENNETDSQSSQNDSVNDGSNTSDQRPNLSDNTGSSSGSGTDTGTGSSTSTTAVEKSVTYTTTRTFTSAASQGSASSDDTVSLVFYRGADTISADQLPASYAVDAPLPSENGSGYSVMIDSRHADAYEFVGWYISQELADQADPNNRLITMPASSDVSVPLYAGIRKKPVTVIITNMFPAAGRFILPQSNADSEGHLYEQVDNRTIVTGYEYGDVLSLPQEKRFLNNPSEDELLQIPHVEGYLGTDHGMDDVLFAGYSTSADVIVSDLLTDSSPDNYRPEGVTECGMFINRSSDVYLYPGSGEPGVGTTVELDIDILTTDQNGELVLKLYAYFATPITVVTQDCGFASSQGSEFTLGAVFEHLVDDMTVMGLAGSGQNAPWARWKVEKSQDVFVMTTWYQGNRTVTIPEFKLLSTDDPNKKVFRVADEEYESLVNNGNQNINENFFTNRSSREVNLIASVVEYVVLDLSGTYDTNSFGVKNPYYIKEEGDVTDHLYKIAILNYEWNNTKNAAEQNSQFGLVDCDNYYSYTSPVKRAFGSDGIERRAYVPVPDDAYYPWGLRGSERVLDPNNPTLAGTVGQTAFERNMFVGSIGKKLLGYTIRFTRENYPAAFTAFYAESVRGRENDYTITLADKTNTGVSLGSLLSIGTSGTFQQDGTGQVTLIPVFGPATALFELSIVYKQDSNNRYIPYIRIGGIAPEYLGYVSMIDFSSDGFGVEYVNVGVNETYRTATLKGLYWNGQAGIRRYMVNGLDDSGLCGEMVLDEQTNTYYQDIPFVYIYNDTENTLDPNNRNVFVRGFVRTPNVSDPNPVYIGYSIGTGNNTVDCKYVASSYTPCASPDVRIKDESYYQYTGFVRYRENGYDPVLTRVVCERTDEFEPWQSVKDLQYYTYRWGGQLTHYKRDLYGWYGQGENDNVDYTGMLIAFNSSGNIHNALHGTSERRYGGLIAQDGYQKPYRYVSVSNPADVTCYRESKENPSVTFEGGVISGHQESGTMNNITGLSSGSRLQLSGTTEDEKSAPEGWMCVSFDVYNYWFKVARDPEHPTAGEAVISRFDIE